MTDIFNDQHGFMVAAGQFESLNKSDLVELYIDLIYEESAEFSNCDQDLEAIKEACDILVVTSGFLIALLGLDNAKKAWELVHASNMAKTQGAIEKREDGKVLKSPEWKKEIKSKLMDDLNTLLI